MGGKQEAASGASRGSRKASPKGNRDAPVVGVGASAGGVSAFQTFVASLPAESGIAWVLIQHMPADRESQLTQILARQTKLPVVEVTNGAAVRPDHVYVIAPGQTLTVRDGMLKTVSDPDVQARRTSIDAFLISLAASKGERCGCALLSGAGTDGTIGLKAVKEAGGLTLTQTLGSAEYDSMLLSAVRTGLVDRELSIEEMPEAFADFLVHGEPLSAAEPIGDGHRLQVCNFLRNATGHDFSGYKASTVDRRIKRRMQMLGLRGMDEYVGHLRSDKEESTRLFRDLLIGVTQFFRDPDAFTGLAQRVLPKILEGKTADDEVRIWVAGCATGEEAYTLAMLLQEAASRLNDTPELRIFATDIDESALHFARRARYPKGIAADISPERLERFFESEDGTYCVRNELREMCLFAQHNMLRDPPFSRIDLIACRNVLIYMNPSLQKRLLPVFHYALRRDGFLFLGPAENAGQAPKLFSEFERKHRIYVRIGESTRLPDFPLAEGDGKERRTRLAVTGGQDQEAVPLPVKALQNALARFAPAYVVVDANYDILEASAGTAAYLELPSGRPRINLAAMARSGLAVDIKAVLAKAVASGKPEVRPDLAVGPEGQRKHLTLVVQPLGSEGTSERCYLVVFQETPAAEEPPGRRRRREPDDDVTRALQLELVNTKERLQTTLEELETSNEELKASNEELSSVNEELQSSNEELETSKEELQSINEELRTVNNELSNRVDELSRANSDLKNLFDTTQIAMLYLDEGFRIVNFTPPAKPLFRLRDHDMGRPLDELSSRIDHGALKSEVETVIRDGEPVEHEVQANGGTPETYIMRILPYRDEKEATRGAVLTFIDITERKRAELHLATIVSELNHRVKNTLASVQALVGQSRRSAARSVDEFATITQGRLQAMAVAHHLLSEADWQHTSLRELSRLVLAPYAEPETDQLTLSGPEIALRPDRAVTLGMILHELATNAVKYGAWSVPQGSVALRWEFRQLDGGMLVLRWGEKAGPAPSTPARLGFGLEFVRRSTEFELHGSCTLEFGKRGLNCTLILPARGIEWTPAERRRG